MAKSLLKTYICSILMIYLFRRNCFFDADIISYSFTLQLIHILWSASQSSHICPLSSPASKILEAKISLIFHQFSLCIFTNFHSAANSYSVEQSYLPSQLSCLQNTRSTPLLAKISLIFHQFSGNIEERITVRSFGKI